MEDGSRRSRPAGVCSGVSERGLLPVCLERRKDSLSASEGELFLNLNKVLSLDVKVVSF